MLESSLFMLSTDYFYPSARWARRGIVVPFVRRRLRHRRMQSFGYHTNMVQHIEFITHTVKPSRQFFFTQGHMSKVIFED